MIPASLHSFLQDQYPEESFDQLLVVHIASQSMYHLMKGQVIQQFSISTALKGPGNVSGSEQTPLGLHEVAEKHGEGLASGSVLSSRVFTGEVIQAELRPLSLGRDLITSRILWLKGLEAGINQGHDSQGNLVDSYQRYIYIHGTAEEGLLGQPFSHGCVRMANEDIITLYPRITPGYRVWITVDWTSP